MTGMKIRPLDHQPHNGTRREKLTAEFAFCGSELSEEVLVILVAVSLHAPVDHRAVENVERGEQRGRSAVGRTVRHNRSGMHATAPAPGALFGTFRVPGIQHPIRRPDMSVTVLVIPSSLEHRQSQLFQVHGIDRALSSQMVDGGHQVEPNSFAVERWCSNSLPNFANFWLDLVGMEPAWCLGPHCPGQRRAYFERSSDELGHRSSPHMPPILASVKPYRVKRNQARPALMPRQSAKRYSGRLAALAVPCRSRAP